MNLTLFVAGIALGLSIDPESLVGKKRSFEEIESRDDMEVVIQGPTDAEPVPAESQPGAVESQVAETTTEVPTQEVTVVAETSATPSPEDSQKDAQMQAIRTECKGYETDMKRGIHLNRGPVVFKSANRVVYDLEREKDLIYEFTVDSGLSMRDPSRLHIGVIRYFFNRRAHKLSLAVETHWRSDWISLPAYGSGKAEIYQFALSEASWRAMLSGPRHYVIGTVMRRPTNCLNSLKSAKIEGALPLKDALFLGRYLLIDLRRLHQEGQIIHGNLRPSTICRHIRVHHNVFIDFDYARLFDPKDGSIIAPYWWNGPAPMQKDWFTSIGELVTGDFPTRRDELFRVMTVIFYLALKELPPTPSQDASVEDWVKWKKWKQFKLFQNIDKPKLAPLKHIKLLNLHKKLREKLANEYGPGEPDYHSYYKILKAMGLLLP